MQRPRAASPVEHGDGRAFIIIVQGPSRDGDPIIGYRDFTEIQSIYTDAFRDLHYTFQAVAFGCFVIDITPTKISLNRRQRRDNQ